MKERVFAISGLMGTEEEWRTAEAACLPRLAAKCFTQLTGSMNVETKITSCSFRPWRVGREDFEHERAQIAEMEKDGISEAGISRLVDPHGRKMRGITGCAFSNI